MNFIKMTAAIVCGLMTAQLFGQQIEGAKKGAHMGSAAKRKFFIRTPYLSFINGIGYDVSMYELHFGYRLTPKDVVGVKAATWSIFESMGIQLWDPNLLKESEWFPGRIREYGIGPIYQRMMWKGLYASIEAMAMKKIFLDEEGEKLAGGFRLYTSYHLGYSISLFKNRLLVEPQIHCNYWPVNSKGPRGFKEQVEKYDNYFLFEPNLYVGVNF